MIVGTGLWEDVIGHPDYEICTEHPHQIRKRSNRKIISESIGSHGYYQVKLNSKPYLKHRLVALQFISNDDPALKTQVDHKNRDKTNNHISYLRWCTVAENNYNRSTNKRSITFVDDLPELVIQVNHYENHDEISNLYYHDDVFYVSVRDRYRVINKHQDYNGIDFIDVTLPDGLRLRISYDKFKQEYELG